MNANQNLSRLRKYRLRNFRSPDPYHTRNLSSLISLSDPAPAFHSSRLLQSYVAGTPGSEPTPLPRRRFLLDMTANSPYISPLQTILVIQFQTIEYRFS